MVNNKIRVNIPDYIARPTRDTRSYHSSKFINIGIVTAIPISTIFFTRTLKEWNALPSFLLDQPYVDAFKSAVTNYFSLPHYTSFYYLLIDGLLLLLFIYLFIYFYYHYFFGTFTAIGNLCEL